MVFDNESLTEIARDFLMDTYGIVLMIPIKVAELSPEAAAQYLIRASDFEPLAIEIAEDTIMFATDDVIIDSLKHECVHHALHVLGRDFFDGDDDFEEELERLGISATHAHRIGIYFQYRCHDCGDSFYYCEYVDPDKSGYKTLCCEAAFSRISGPTVWNGKEQVI